ncbi:multidrug effflux MFS transporter [Pseudomonas sp. NFX224]|uniref:multidrug effflux MFS transporter n=1 Tax=Pseudomonas sp. NFX224 TaxID=3402862 RepID=UPI003AFA3BF2
MSDLRARRGTIALLASLTAFPPLSIDTYLPSLPQIGRELMTNESAVQSSIGVFLLAMCLGMLVHGPLSDRFGRRRVLQCGIALYLASTVGCALSPDVDRLILFRFFQGLGGAAASVLARAIVRDVFPVSQAAKILSWMHLATMLATLIAPLLGSGLLQWGGWRSIFAALFALALVSGLLAAKYLPESHPPEARVSTLLKGFASYLHLIKSRTVMAYIGCMGLCFGGMFAFITGSPFVYMNYFGVAPAAYAALFASNIVAIILMTLINAHYVSRWGHLRMIFAGACVSFISALTLILTAYLDLSSLPLIVICAMAFISVTGLLGANCVAALLSLRGSQAGAVAALAVACQFALGAGFSALVGALSDGTARPMCLVMGLAGIGCFACAWIVRIQATRERCAELQG